MLKQGKVARRGDRVIGQERHLTCLWFDSKAKGDQIKLPISNLSKTSSKPTSCGLRTGRGELSARQLPYRYDVDSP